MSSFDWKLFSNISRLETHLRQKYRGQSPSWSLSYHELSDIDKRAVGQGHNNCKSVYFLCHLYIKGIFCWKREVFNLCEHYTKVSKYFLKWFSWELFPGHSSSPLTGWQGSTPDLSFRGESLSVWSCDGQTLTRDQGRWPVRPPTTDALVSAHF